ncbi:MAG: HAMP domain-containing histidine kinase [Ktedonobacteraceae bacterium]|nr:HAMP domain-containing histidine kinase [Ktedonobacteraceae bacterium]
MPARLPWWRSQITGYLVSPILVGMLTLARLFATQPLFIWAPFCLVVVLTGFLWGPGPALLAMTLAILAISYLIIPQYDLLTLDIWNDIMLLGPFAFVQILIALLASQNAIRYRRALATKQELQAYAQDLAEANRQLEMNNRLKDYFFTRAAHELRTPLTTILGEAQLALRRLNRAKKTTNDLAVWQAHFARIEERSRGLHALVEDLIELYNLRSEEIPLRRVACDLSNLCLAVVEEQRTQSGRQIELQLPSDPIMLQADGERLRQAFVNILDNAIRYSPKNTTIQVRVCAAPAYAIIDVHNDDSELSQEQQERIFEPFYRTPSAEASGQGGWGLGLTFSKECIERHGGRIWVESSEKKGVTLFIELPR